jgi:hypothetical protein
MKALAISMLTGTALYSAMAVPASAIPMSDLAAAASNLAPGESVRYVRNHYRNGFRGYSGPYPTYLTDVGRGGHPQ